MRLSPTPVSLRDDLELNQFTTALEANIKQLRKDARPLDFGPRRIEREKYIRALESLLVKASEDPSGDQMRAYLQENFEPYEVYGQEKWGQVFITSYFEPVMEGSTKKTEKFSKPIYGPPRDMVIIDMKGATSRGRYVPPVNKDAFARIVAYPDRGKIDGEVLPAEVLAWVDPVDGFFLEIQGSGAVRFKDGREIRVGYAAQNGHPYVAIGKHLLDVMPKERITMHSIEAHLRSLPAPAARELMARNPSYVFFKKLQGSGVTYFGTEVVDGRTIATDQTYFPKGALAYLEFEKPVFSSGQDVEPSQWQPTGRLVFDQDIGGAIRGPDRVDLFWGKGPGAKQAAGVVKNKGRLVYLVPRPALIDRL